MTTKTFIVTVSNPGSGDKFFLDGVQQATISLAYGATYRFDQSDSSNAGNLLKFSETSDGVHGGGSAYNPGVTVVGTPGSAGAYTEFFVTEVGPPNTMFYFSVQNSGLGGTANLTSNSWGALGWNKGTWSDQGHIDEEVTGLSASFSIGEETISTEINTGWGRLGWTVQPWGNNETIVDVPVTGMSMTSSIGEETAEGEINVGWGRQAWGNSAWGEAFSVAATGQSITSTIGTAVASADFTAVVSGLQSNFTLANIALQIDGDITVTASEDQLDFSIGSSSISGDANITVSSAGSITSSQGNTIAGLKTPVDVSGIQATFTLGTFTLVQSTNESATGQQLASSIGTPAEIPSQMVGVSGQQLSSSVGSVSVTGIANIDVTGIQLTANLGSVNITPWQEVDLGVTNNWTEVDLAA